MPNKSYEYATKVLAGDIVAPSQVRQACINFLHEYYCTKALKKLFFQIYTKGIRMS